jgi:gliding motility-associated-like protein/uncharacterized repeat protein (TIGR01451 family)
MNSKVLLFYFALIISFSGAAQLSDLHYLPPLKQGQNNAGIRQQAVYLSTPEPTTFTVNAYRGTNTTPVATFNISNVNPAVYSMSNGDNNIILVNNANTGVVLNNSGLRFESPSGNRFYVNYRGSSNAQSASLTSKGRVALGTTFKWGGVPNRGQHPSKSNTLGIMATEDNTTINLFGYDPGCEFRVGNNRAGITANTHQITLDANESFVYETYIGNSPTQAHEDGWIGASIVSDKDIVISNGSMNFGRQVGASNRDAGIDQPVPENRLGKEYVFVRGNGNANGWTEFPLLIAISDNTQIFVNGSATPIATINNGDYFEIPSNMYSSNVAGANMLVETSKDVYAYQCMAGATTPYTQGLNFVAPVNCLLPDVMDNIPDIRNMAGTTVTGGMTIIAAVNTPDANIIVNDDNGPITLPASTPVAGSTDWKTFYIPNLNGDVSVTSTGPMAVGFFGFNGARGVAGYFSGFDTVPEVNLEIRGGSGCFVGSEIFEATDNNFDAFQWYKDGVLIPDANSPSYTPDGAGEYFLRGTKGPCTYDSNSILGLYCDPDIAIEKTVDNSEIMEGETATFTIRIQNWGVGPLTNLQVTDNIPTGLTLVNAFTITGSFSGNTWDIGTLEGGEVAELELEVRADEIDTLPLLSITNIATHTQDQTDTNITPDSPSAIITVHNDFDNDGVIDIVDLDDDNDGVYDEVECETLSFNIASGSPHNSNLISVEDYLILDIFSLDNSFNLEINGTDIAGEIQFQAAPGNFARFFDGFGYGEDGNPQIYTLTGSQENPLLRVIIDQAGQFQLFGARTSNGPLEPMQLTTPANTLAWNPSGNNTISINQTVTGPTNMSGVLLTAGCDTDNDGIPNQLDLDSDDDGCSDANEFYKEDNADGGDGGEYGTGVPVVDATNGTVNAASYVQVFAPEILLGNTTQDLGGADINGQALNLGDTYNYVLTFQNTGDANAANYTIRDILPNNITLDNIEVPIGLGITNTYDVDTNTIVFTIPDNLVQVGDPVYQITITVTLASNCSDFTDACSSELENLAYSTYQDESNTTTFTDEGGSNSITACPRSPEVASNSILNGLASCSQARTVQLCGDDVVLTAGAGFTTYNWAIDANNNGVIDGGESLLNDGDPDSNPSTLLVTDIGNYIVEKSGNGTCPDLTERITVERFGTTQTNPIIDYFNQVNSDANPNNDLQGEIVTCSVDGDLLPKIFLCGAAAEATIQLGITDADSIIWEKLDEASCTDSGADCANKNGTCTWNGIDTGSNFTVSDSGEYRVVINYSNGCFSRFYLNIFKNELDIDYTSTDILCDTSGTIRITNISAGYGFRLIDVATNTVVVPFSANNGPDFNIATSGTYRVEATQINPSDGTPIPDSCIFETEDIGIQEQNFSVNLNTTPADCNQLGSITVQALNALPNYSYELRLDDGSNGGLGSLVSSQPTLIDNSYTFSDVNPEDYIVVTTTQDGCSDSQQIEVTEIPELTLTAVTSENITCTAGIVNVSVAGGLPSPNYEIAIWSKDAVNLYADEVSVPDADYQTTLSFLFGYRGTPSTYFPNEDGDYQFIVRDGNGCYAISNSVRVDDLDSLSISASDSGIVCADSATASLSVSVTGGTAPYQYSLDGGTNYQNTNTFVNLSAGLYTITVMDSSNGTNCVEDFDYEITQPFRLTASASIIEDASCNPAGALVKILNPNGGQAPYVYSFDGGSNFAAIDEQNLLPGSYSLVVRDDLGCTFNIDLTIPTVPADPSFDQNVFYDCNGLGRITIDPSNTGDFDYSYALDGTPNTPESNNIFDNLTDGTYTISVDYINNGSPNQVLIFNESFGAGPTTQIDEIGSNYCYEPQDGSTTNCNRGPAGILVNGEYTVTNFVTNPVSFWTSPQDHTGLTDGRFLSIDVSNFSDTGNPQLNNILWARRNLEVFPNEEVNLNFWAYNLMNVSGSGNNPQVRIEILDNTGAVIYSETPPEIPKNTNDTDWHQRTITFNPGANTDIDIVFRTNVNSNDGNDLILDDIQASQLIEICEKSTDITVIVDDNQEFGANLLGTINPSCNGGSDGTIRFEVNNFDAVTGFEYAINGGTFVTSLVSPVTTTAPLEDGTYTVAVRRINDISCATDFTATLTEPTALVADASITDVLSCTNTGATITASANDGTPTYQYQLEITDDADFTAPYTSITTIVTPFQNSPIFNNVAQSNPGESYVVRVRDNNGCEDVIDASIIVEAPNTIVFDLTPTDCYSGSNDATILVNVTDGNGDYQFRIDGGPWLNPTNPTDTTFTFDNLSNNTYSIEVRDGLGCTPAAIPATINTQLSLSATASVISVCDTDTDITVTPNGGDGNYVFSVVDAGDTPTDASFNATNPLTGFVAGNYEVYVRDNNGDAVAGFCQEVFPITITQHAPLSFTPNQTNVNCNGVSNGAISITSFAGGQGPYTYSIDNGVTYVTNSDFTNLSAGTYQVRIQDSNNCQATAQPITITEPDALTAEATQTQQYTCAQLGQITIGSVTATDGGSNNYQYRINGGAWTVSTTSGHTFIDLDDDTYSISVRDANAVDCFITLPDVIIAPLPTAPLVDYTVAYNCDGTGTVTVTPFDASFTYVLDGNSQTGATGNIFNNIAVGSFDLRVNYSTDCNVDSTVIIENGNAFEASITAFENLDCTNDASGTITINADNYGTGGYEYSLDGTTFSGPFTTAETITGLDAIAHTITVRDVDTPIAGCSVILNQTLTEPNALVADASITDVLSCTNTGATITASANDGTPTYQYQLEITDDADFTAPYTSITTIVTPFQNSPIFNNVAQSNPGESYVVRVRDNNGCEDVIDASIIVEAPNTIVFDLTPTDCYSGSNDATILVNVTDGNGDYQFRIDGGPWLNPTNPTDTTFTFDNLSNNTYSIEVRDGLGCPPASNTQTVAINPQLVLAINLVELSACGDGSITANATGGNGTLLYAIVPANTSPTGLFSTTNTLTITEAMATANPAGYDVYVQDNNGTPAICSTLREDIILTPATPLTVTGTATDPECFDGLGAIDVTVGGGTTPYTYTLTDLSPADGIDYGRSNTNISATTLNFSGIGVGDYEVTVTDENTCSVTSSILTITNAIEITADIAPILPATCNDPDPLEYGFEFDNVITPGGTVEYSADGGTSWQASNELRGYASGSEVFPSIRVTLASGIICQKDFDRYLIPFPLDDLDITLSAIVVGCNDLRVTVEGSEGDGTTGYDYTYTDDPANFSTFIADPNVWVNNVPSGTSYTFQNIDPSTPDYPGVPLLVPGRTYVFYVRDGSGCIRQSNVNVNDIPGISLPIDITTDITPTCDSAITGSITFTLNPDTAYPNMRWEIYELGNTTPIETSGGNVTYNNTITTTIPLAEGEYYIDVVQVEADNTTDACRGASENAYLSELAPLSATAVVTRDISCNLPGLIAINGISGGGGAPYTYDVTGPAGFTTLTGTTNNPVEISVNSPAGNYTVTLYDQYSCPLVLNTVPLTLSPNPTLSVSQDNCAAPITVNAVGSSTAGNMRYAIVTAGNPAPTTFEDNGGTFDNVIAGSYDIYVIDGNGCTAVETNFTVNPVLAASTSLTKLLDCTPTPDAIINIEILDGSGSYEYSITNTVGAPPVTQTGVPSTSFDYQAPLAGDYTIIIYDTTTPNSASCNREFTVNIPDRLEPNIDITDFTNVTCNAADDGTITVNANPDNGIGPYTFQIMSGPSSTATFPITGTGTPTSATFSGLEGTTTGITYTIRVTAANGCFTETTQVITQPEVITLSVPTIVQFACTTGNNENNASITVDVAAITGGTAPYRYAFTNNTTSVTVANGTNPEFIITDLTGATYTVTVFDQNDCPQTQTAVINPYDQLVSTSVTVDQTISCTNGGEDITLNAVGTTTDTSTPAGLANYEFRILPAGVFAAANTFIDLPVGTHNFEVRNINTNCILPAQHTVLEPNNVEVTATTTDVVCHGTDGTVSFTINDPVNTYTNGFSWQIYNSQGTIATGDDTIITAANGTSANVGPTTPFAIPAGEYRIEITQDSNPDCSVSQLFAIAGPSAALTASTTIEQATCNLGDGVIEITNPQGGWSGYEYFVALATAPAPTATDFESNPRFTTLAGAAMPAGLDYQVWIMDQRECMVQLPNVTLYNPEAINATLQINQDNCTDFSGEVQVTAVTGGQGSNYTYQLLLNGTAIRAPQNTTTFSGLGAGDYTVQVTDQWDCSFTTTAVTLYEVVAPNADIVKPVDCNSGGDITITQTGGSGTFNYEVRNSATAPTDPADDTSATGIFTNLAMDTYTFTVIDTGTSDNCQTTITQTLENPILPNIDITDFTNVTCNTADDGTITVSANPDNGIGPYTFEIVTGSGSSATFPITGTGTPTSATFSGLEGTTTGITYTIRVTAANGCFTETTQVITQPEVIANFTVNTTDFECTTGNDENNASITITGVTGGSGTYTYVFIEEDDPNTVAIEAPVTVQSSASNSFSSADFDGGSYTINIYDQNGCSATTTAIINPFDSLGMLNIQIDDAISCSNLGEDISIDIVSSITNYASNPTNYEFRMLPSGTVQTSNTFTDLQPDSYTFEVTNLSTNCKATVSHTVADPNTFNVTVTKLADAVCYGDEGSIELVFSDASYTGVYEWEILNTDGSSTTRTDDEGTFTGSGTTAAIPVAAGTFLIRVVQVVHPECEQERSVTITTPSAPITLDTLNVTDVGCSNDQGSATISPLGGQAPYSITLTNNTTGTPVTVTNVNGHIFSDLTPAAYSISVTDALSCTVNFANSFELLVPDPISGTISNTAIVCQGDTDASVSISLNPRNVTSTYSFVLNKYDDNAGSTLLQSTSSQTSPSFNNLGAGFYNISVTDAMNCTFESTIVEIEEPTETNGILVTTASLSCSNGAELELVASGGTAPYMWSTDGVNFNAMNTTNGPNTHVFQNVTAGNYQYYIRDNFNCISTISNGVVVNPIEALTLELNTTGASVNCNGESTALIEVRADGGLGNYQYGLFADTGLLNEVRPYQASGIFSNLSQGSYFVHVQSGDCQTLSQEIRIEEPTPLMVTSDITEINCSGANDGSIVINAQGGSGDYQFAISPNLNQFSDENSFAELAPGNYDVIAQDSNGCFELIEFNLIAPTEISAVATVTDEICFESEDGTISLEISGGTAPYFTALNSNNDADFVQDVFDYSNLPSGTHVVFVRDANGCEYNEVFEINSGVNLAAEILVEYSCSSIQATNTIGLSFEDQTIIDDLLFGLDTADTNEMVLQSTFNDLSGGDHYITVLHSNGCINTFEFTIEEFLPLQLIAEQQDINEITALAEGGREGYTYFFNDVDNGDDNKFYITETDTYTVRVVDENGCETATDIFMEFIDIEIPTFFTPDGDDLNDYWLPRNIEQFPNIFIKIYDRYGRQVYELEDNEEGWDGLYQDYDLPTGDYWYLIKLNGENDQREMVGHFTLYR